MDDTDILFWIVAIPTFSTFLAALVRYRSSAQGWSAISAVILLILFFARLQHDARLIYAALGMWLLLVVLPSVLSKFYNDALLQLNYARAYGFARVISLLHPFDGWREQPRIVHALGLAYRGDVAGGIEILKQFQHVTSPAAHTAMINLYRITNRWEEFLDWVRQLPPDAMTNLSFVPVVLRARAEVGDLQGMIELYDRNRPVIAKLAPAANRDFCRLILFAFSGRRDLVEHLLDGPLRLLPGAAQTFWLATADLTAGNDESARRKLEQQLPSADPSTRRAIERRLSKPLPSAAILDRAHWQIIEEAAREQGHEEVFHAAPPLFSKASRATQILIAANFVMFALEVYLGGATNSDVLMRLGAMYPPAVRAGEWWRLGAALFLHFGALHVCMNMIGLWALGPFVEFALGSARYLFLYLAAGVGSMFIVMKFGSGPYGHHTTVGASGSIMALVGATGGLMLKGWIQQRAHPARQRLQAVITILAMQTVFDAMIPEVSMTAHLSGALLGFVLALIIPNKLTSRR